MTTPRGTGIRSVNVAIRKELDLYTCLRPCKLYSGVRTRFSDTGVNLVVVRENTEDLYAGVEWESGSEEARQIIGLSKGRIRPDAAISIKPISPFGSERIVEFAFKYAVANGRKKVTTVAKDNIMKATDGLFFHVAREVAKRYEGRVQYDEWLVDSDVHAVGAKAGVVRRAGDAEPLRRHSLRPLRRLIGGLGVAPAELRRRDRGVRGHPRLRAQVRGDE